MKKYINQLTSFALIALAVQAIGPAGEAQAQTPDIHNPAACGLYRGTPYLSDWSQRWLTNTSGSAAAEFWLQDTNSATALWNAIFPFASLANTNALTPSQQNAVNQLVGGYLTMNYNLLQNSLVNAGSLASEDYEVTAPPTLTVSAGGIWGNISGSYTFIGSMNVASGVQILPAYASIYSGPAAGGLLTAGGATLIPGLTNALSVSLYAGPYTGGPGGTTYSFLAQDNASTNFCIYETAMSGYGGATLWILETTMTTPAGYVYTKMNNPPAATLAFGTPPSLWSLTNNPATFDLTLTPHPSSSSNFVMAGVNLSAQTLTASGTNRAAVFVGNGGSLTGLTPSQVGAVAVTDPTYLSVFPGLAFATNASVTASSAWVIANANLAALNTVSNQVKGATNTVTAAMNVTPMTVTQPGLAFNTPYVNPTGRRAWLYVSIQSTNITGITFENLTSGMVFAYTNTATSFRRDTFTIPLSPGDSAEIITNSYTSSLSSSWLIGM